MSAIHSVIPAPRFVGPTPHFVIPAPHSVIPAKAGIQSARPAPCSAQDRRLRGNFGGAA